MFRDVRWCTERALLFLSSGFAGDEEGMGGTVIRTHQLFQQLLIDRTARRVG